MPGNDPGGWIITILIGLAGSFIGTYLGQAVGLYRAGEPAVYWVNRWRDDPSVSLPTGRQTTRVKPPSTDWRLRAAIIRRQQSNTNTTMELTTLKDLYIHELKDLYSAEKQIITALPKMVKAASNEQLAAGFKEHLEQTKGHAVRLEKILSSHNQTTRGPKRKGMEGLVKEGAELIEKEADDDVRDAGLISAAQRVEHYEMAGYGCARTYADCSLIRKGRNSSRRHLRKSLIPTKSLPSLQLP